MSLERLGTPPVLKDGTAIPLSPAVKVGNMLYLSGVLPFREDGSFAEGDIEEQTRQCIRNIEKVLSLAGAGLDNVAKATVWLVRKEDFPGFNKAYAESFSGRPPARSTVCSDLMLPGPLVEIEVVAALD